MAGKKTGLLHMLADAAEIYSAKYVLPYAGHFALWRPEHREFQARIARNTMDDVREALRGTATLIDALPGDEWIAAENRVNRGRGNTERYYDAKVMERYLRRNFERSKSELAECAHLSAERIDEYFLQLNQVPEIHFCEDLTFDVVLMDTSYKHEIERRGYELRNGAISVSPHAETPNVVIRLPVHVASQLVADDLSWDEAFIGYWCRFSRSPDVYHAGFWRLLQAPYYRRSPGELPKSASEIIFGENSVSEIVQRHGKSAERIMRRYGLYCVGCQNAEAESIVQAGATHGLAQSNVDRLLKELNAL
jgi:CMP-N-acetylneuraminate monooxygenase